MTHARYSFRLLVAALLLVAGPAIAEETYRLSIPPQPLTKALQSFAAQSGMRVVHYAQITEDKMAPAVEGNYTRDGALGKLLVDSGLRYVYVNKNTVAIRPASAEDVTATQLDSSVPGTGKDAGSEAVSGFNRIRVAQTDTAQSDAPARPDSSTDSKAASALEEVVVTAERREESIQNLPIAISAFSGETLAGRKIEGLETLQQIAPSLQFGFKEGGHARVSIRGVGADQSGEPGVAVVVDGVPYVSPWASIADFLDIERVEVLRGPQGTISGRNATGGAIHVHSKRPTEEFEGGLTATLGSYSRMAAEGYLSGPIAGDWLLGRLAVRRDAADGWVNNTLLDQDLGSTDKFQARASLIGRLNESFEAHLILEGFRDESTLFFVDDGRARPDTPSIAEFFGVPGFDKNGKDIRQDVPSNTEVEKYQATLKLTWDLGPSANLTAITGYLDASTLDGADFDSTSAPVAFRTLDTPFIGVRQVSQEVTLTADLTDRLDVIAGALYLEFDEEFRSNFWAPLAGLPEGSLDLKGFSELTSWGAYTQWRYRLTNNTRLSAGIRYLHDSRSKASRNVIFFAPSFADVEHSWSGLTPRFAIDYTPSDDLTLYASVSRGYKSGDFQAVALPVETYEPEYVWNYEAGVKASWLENRLKTAVTGFHMSYTDLQQNLYGVAALARVYNTSAAIDGMELELDALVTDQFRITFAGTWLDATYDGQGSHDLLFPELGEPGPVGLNLRDLSGNQILRAPEWQFNISGEYRAPLGDAFFGKSLQGVLRASYGWQDKIFFDFFNNEGLSQSAYGLINLFGAIETADGRWQLAAFANNLADEFYVTHKLTLALGPVPVKNAHVGLPRTYGVSLSYRF